MKKHLLLVIFSLFGICTSYAQKFALIDMEYILENIPAYQKANNDLTLISKQYQQAIEAKTKEAETLYNAYQKASSTMNASQRTQKEEAIVDMFARGIYQVLQDNGARFFDICHCQREEQKE